MLIPKLSRSSMPERYSRKLSRISSTVMRAWHALNIHWRFDTCCFVHRLLGSEIVLKTGLSPRPKPKQAHVYGPVIGFAIARPQPEVANKTWINIGKGRAKKSLHGQVFQMSFWALCLVQWLSFLGLRCLLYILLPMRNCQDESSVGYGSKNSAWHIMSMLREHLARLSWFKPLREKRTGLRSLAAKVLEGCLEEHTLESFFNLGNLKMQSKLTHFFTLTSFVLGLSANCP